MEMQRELAAVYHELKRRQLAGEKSVYLSGESLDFLRETAALISPARAPETGSPPAAPAPEAAGKRLSKARPTGPEVPCPPVVKLTGGTREERWEALRDTVLSDSWCLSQVKPGKKVVLGIGTLNARIFFCGEAPGAEEEIQGEPFVGPAGQLLTKIIQAMGLARHEVYIGNIMNYRPPIDGPVGNRAPTADEMAYCLPYLKAQLAIVQPEAIVALGKTAVEGLLGHDPKRRMTRIRGHWDSFEGIPLIPTFHPSYLLRNQSMKTKREVWEDMLAVMERLSMDVSEKQRGYFL